MSFTLYLTLLYTLACTLYFLLLFFYFHLIPWEAIHECNYLQDCSNTLWTCLSAHDSITFFKLIT